MKLFRFMRRFGVGTKFVSTSIAILLVIQSASYLVTERNIDSIVRQQVKDELITVDANWWALMEQRAASLRQSVLVLASDFGFRDAVLSGDTETIRSVLDNSSGRIGATFAALLTVDYKLQASSTDEFTEAGLVEFFQQTASRLASGGDGYALIDFDEKLLVTVMVPLNAPVQAGWVMMAFPITREQVEDLVKVSRADLAIIGSTGGVTVSSLPSSTYPALLNLKDGGNGILNGREYVARKSSDRSHSSGLEVYMLRPIDVFVEPFSRVEQALLALAAIALLLFTVGSFILARRITVPLRKLSKASDQLSAGDYSMALPALRHRDEIGDLSRAFNHMRTSIQSQQDEIRALAFWDRLTGLPNRIQFRDLVTMAINSNNQESGTGQPVTIVMLNLDRFKFVNNVLGYAFGDQLLIAVAERLVSIPGIVRENIARVGGDEFAIVLEGVDSAGALPFAKQVAQAFEAPMKMQDQTVDISAGIGIASWPSDAGDVDRLLSRAVIAMYVAKNKSTGIQIYHAALDSSSPETLSMLSELRHAVENNELRVYLQPKLHIASGTVSSAEALVRWQHPVRGLVPPMQFIPFAEQTGYIRQMTLWMFEEVARNMQLLNAGGGPLCVSVNLSTRDLLDQDFPDKLEDLMRKHGVATDSFCLEITESAIMDDPDRAEATLNRLSQRGFKLSIDDFGTGYSSLAYLKRLPVNELKIDKSFVMGMDSNESDSLIVKSTIELAHNLGKTVVAEGVENQAITDKLRALSCDEAQGYHLSRPLPLDQFNAWRLKFSETAAVQTAPTFQI
ncbi:MAG: EAL domain-containing protein [Rhodoferax sp.]|uniref:bifunctional diguanylate cyclase/phosphodiesterase n=1 Tax=Rhodoferax sp. TaxID=50421 RepID=UPI002ACD8316|nr:EAL domain-containing protein [Rhodoferax sp.]MDZ7892265.1 EAL domain-containing protein [Rhodoferax sp.]